MNVELKKKLEQKIKDELTRNAEELKLIDINLAMIEKKKHHLIETVSDWQNILNELMLTDI
jgi:hypothetical protein